MPTVRLTAFFKDDDGHGWSETHDKDGGSSITSLTSFLQNFDSLMVTARRPLLAGDAFYIGCRASYRTPNGTIAGDNIQRDPPVRGPQTYLTETLTMTAPEVAVKSRLRNDSSTARSDVYLRGVWKQVVDAGVLDFNDGAGEEWKRRADIYYATLIAQGYGWVGTDPAATSRGAVTGYVVVAPPGPVPVTVAVGNAIALPAVGTRVNVKFARINDSDSVLNRALTCTVTSPTLLTTVKAIAAGPFESPGTYIATRTGFIPYAALSYYKLGHRKTGRPFGVAPGRLPARALS